MTFVAALEDKGRHVAGHRPWPRIVVDTDTWRQAVLGIAAGQATLLGLWSDGEAVHLCLSGETSGKLLVISLPCPDKRFPSVAQTHPPALRLERTIRDLYGIEPEGCPDARRWLDHGRWGLRHPLGAAEAAEPAGDTYAFHTAEGPPLHQIPVGPVHAGIIEPGHFRFHANGETVVRLEERLGYVHKGIDHLMAGAPRDRAAKLAGRTSGDSTVAYALGFAQAVEAALDLAPSARAVWLRALMAELERLANHFGDIGAICNDASFSLMHAHCSILREHVLRVSETCFGHRLMMDRIVPGGVATDLSKDGIAAIRTLIRTARRRFPRLVELYDNTASLQNRTVTTGILKPDLARQYGAGGVIGRASGRSWDARKLPGYAPYTSMVFDIPRRDQGDVDARVWIRIEEVRQSLTLIDQILDRTPEGSILTEAGAASRGKGEGLALVEGFRGDILVWVRLNANGTIARCHLRDPSWLQWPLLEAAIEGNIVADFPICNKSFNCSYSGHDL
ncbi:MAG: hydrogenase expression protein HypE [Hyphomicrobiaceae bacterium]|nr:MAG: hydrogenase expression protein HypE [Hyphomicrobiaceae bacterium]